MRKFEAVEKQKETDNQPKTNPDIVQLDMNLKHDRRGFAELPSLEVLDDAERTQPVGDAVADKKSELEKTYHIKFETSQTSPYGDRVREPSLDELRALESALRKSSASALQSSSSKEELRVVFLKDKIGDEATLEHQAFNEGSRIVVRGPINWPPTRDDVQGPQRNTKEAVTLEREFLHELGHQAESAMATDPEKMGWKKTGDSWSKQSKDGRLWQFDFEKASHQIYQWYEVDETGKRKENSTMSNTDMMQNAKIKPASDYFRTPQEDFAEGIRLYRTSTQIREQFEKDNPELSKYIAEYDQQEIRTKLGIDDNHKPLYLRDENGNIVPNPESTHQPQGTVGRIQDAVWPYILPIITLY